MIRFLFNLLFPKQIYCARKECGQSLGESPVFSGGQEFCSITCANIDQMERAV